MENWKTPTLSSISISKITSIIKVKASSYRYPTLQEAAEMYGPGYQGYVTLPDGTVEEAYIASIDFSAGIINAIINGISRFYNWITGLFS